MTIKAEPVAGTPATSPTNCAVHAERAALTTCPRCGTFACDDCLARGPGGSFICGACRRRRPGTRLSWRTSDEESTPGAFWRTCVRMIRAPVVTLERTEPDAPVASSWLFAFLARMVGTLPTVSIWILLAGPSFDQYVARQGGSSEGANAIYVVVAIFCLMVQLLGAVAWPMMGAACDHLSLIIVRARPSSYRVTLHGWALAQGPMLTGLLPLISVYIQPWWTLVLRINAYRVFHRISDSRAFFAVALSMLIAIVLLGIVVALVSSLAALVMIALVQPSSPPA